jgi:predicted glycosyltransferase
MNILFHLGHPAHFHLFKNTIKSLKFNGHSSSVLIKKKDILEDLLKESGLQYYNILPHGRKDSKFYIAVGLLKQSLRLLLFCLKRRPDILVGTSVSISHVGKLLRIPSINVNEDDADVVPLYAKLAYPWASHIIAPKVCRMGKWVNKTIPYDGYHELAYLHPNNFDPNIEIAKKYVSMGKPYFILRFAKLGAHHDAGIKGLSNKIAIKLIKILSPYGKVYITSERELSIELEENRIQINPIDIHHVMAYSSLYIGDSQTMAAEAGVLGVPFIRFNDFVGRISYLDELENKYKLGFGIKTKEVQQLYNKVEELVSLQDYSEIFQNRRIKMLSEKIEYSSFLTWFIENYPSSIDVLKQNPNYQTKF